MALSAEEVAAIVAYTGTAYRAINDYLRTNGSGDQTIEQQVLHLDRVLSNNPTPAALIVYRGIGEALATQLARRGLAAGDIIQDMGYLSTSRRQDIASAFMRDGSGMLLAIRVPVATNALDIATFSAYPNEEEVLLARNAQLRVTGYDSVGDILELELLGDE